MNLKDFITKYKGKKVEFHSYGNTALYQCVDLVNQYMTEVWNVKPIIGTNACDFSTKFNKDELTFTANTPKGVPDEGSVVVWNNKVGGGAGHVAVFISGDNKSFTSFDQNWNSDTCQETNHNYNNVTGWLSPINLSQPMIIKPSDTLPEPFYKITEAKEAQKRGLITPKDAWDTVLSKFIQKDKELNAQKTHFDEEQEALIEEKKVLQEKLDGVSADLNARNSYVTQLEAKVKQLEEVSNNIPTSAKNRLNLTDWQNWFINTLQYSFQGGVIAVLTAYSAGVTDLNQLKLVFLGALSTSLVDLIKKLRADNGGK